MLIPEDYIWIVVLGFIIAFILAFGIGANDVANSFGTSVGSGVLTLRNAFIIATVCETLGAVLIGSSVSNTIRKGVLNMDVINQTNYTTSKNVDFMLYGQLSSLTGACIWLLLATVLNLPVSGSHSIVGAVVGFVMVVYGPKGVNWLKIIMIVISWFASPLLSGGVTVLLFLLFERFILRKEDPLEPGLMFLPYIYGFSIFVNIISILLHGPKLLQFDKIPLYGMFIISIGLSIIIACLLRFIAVPRMRGFITENCRKMKEKQNMKNDEFQMTVPINDEKEPNKCDDGGDVDNKVDVETNCTRNKLSDKPEQDAVFGQIQILAAIFSSFAHGGNDISNAIGPLIALWIISSTQNIFSQEGTPIWVVLYGCVGICVGLWMLGKRVIKTVGTDLTIITPSSGVSIELGAALTVLVASNIGIPVSTTHCKVGSVVCVGRYRDRGNVNWKLFINVALAWIITVPFAAALSALCTFSLVSLLG